MAWHLLMFMPSSLIRYAALDEETKMFFTHMFVGSMPAYQIKNKVLALIAEGVLKQDVLPLLKQSEVPLPEVRSPAA